MAKALNLFFAYFQKDLRLELRSGANIVPQLALSSLLSLLAGIGIAGMFIEPPLVLRIFPLFLWIIYLVVSTIGSERAMHAEFAHNAIERQIVKQATLAPFYVSKVLSCFLSSAITFSISLALFLAILPISLPFELYALSLLVILGHSSLTVLLAPLSVLSRLRGLLILLIAIPITLPLFFGVTELFLEVLVDKKEILDSPWMLLVVAYTVLFSGLGVGLFDKCVKG